MPRTSRDFRTIWIYAKTLLQAGSHEKIYMFADNEVKENKLNEWNKLIRPTLKHPKT